MAAAAVFPFVAALLALSQADETSVSGDVPADGEMAAVPTSKGDATESVLLFEIDFGPRTLLDSTTAFGDPPDPLLPLGELTRVLDLDVAITGLGLASGRIGAAQRPLTIDVRQHLASIGSSRVALADSDTRVTETEIYIRASVLERLLPLRIAVDPDALIISLTGTETLPFEERNARLSGRTVVGDDPAMPETLAVSSPYRWIGAPAFDFGAAVGTDSARSGYSQRFEARVAADVLKSTFTGFIGTDDTGQPSSALFRLERRDPTGQMFGPLHATYAAAGDVYTPSLAIGARSFGGMGLSVSTARILETSVFQRITLRGELPLGYDVELYVNEVLRGAQDKSVQGRYEFVDVPLTRGRNVVRIVAFGPHGEQTELTRVINAGSGQIAAGQLSFDAGIVLEDKPVISFDRLEVVTVNPRRGKPRAVAQLAYGLSPTLTATGGVAHYSDGLNRERNSATVGLRTSLAGIAVQADYAKDIGRGSALAIGMAGSLGPVSYFARDAEYTGDFNDETNPFLQASRPLRRSSEGQLDVTLNLFSKNAVPVSLRGLRAEYVNGDTSLFLQGRTTVMFLDTLVAFGTDYRADRTGTLHTDTWSGDVAASRRLADWQLRATATADFANGFDLRGLAVTGDRRLSDRLGLRMGVAKSFGTIRDMTAQAGLNAQLPFADISLSGAYSTEQRRWQAGLQLNFGLAFDPFRRSYRVTRPGPSSGASAAILAFVDADADGVIGHDERRLEGVRITGTANAAVTNGQGEAFVTGLGSSPQGAFRVDSSAIDDVFLTSPAQDVTFAARAGQVLRVAYPFTPTSEVVIGLEFEQGDGKRVGLSALDFQLVSANGQIVAGRTEFDGTAVLEDVKPGRYSVRLDPAQAARLKMHLAQPIEFVVTADAGSVRATGTVEFEGDT